MGIEGLIGPFFSFLSSVPAKFFKDQPRMQISPEQILGGGSVYTYLSVTNISKYNIQILSIKSTGELFQIWKDDSIKSAVQASDGKLVTFVLEPEETRHLPLLPVERRPENEDIPSWLVLRWRSLRHPSWWRLPVFLKLSHAEFDRIERASID
jgi:hypothetical protein